MAMKTLKTWNKLVTLMTLESHKTLIKLINQGHVFIMNIPNSLIFFFFQIKEDTQIHVSIWNSKFFGIKKFGNSKKMTIWRSCYPKIFSTWPTVTICAGPLCPQTEIFSYSLSINVFSKQPTVKIRYNKTNGQDLRAASCQYLPTLPTNKFLKF